MSESKVNRMIGKRRLITVVMLVALVCMSVFGVLNLDTVRLSAYESPAIYITPPSVSPPDPEAANGTNYTFSVLTDYNGSDVWGFEFDLTFDPTVLEGIEVVDGGLINTTVGPIMWNNGTFDNTAGTLKDVGNSFRYTNNVTSGPGTLANITFKVVGCGISNITFVDRETRLMGASGGEVYNIIDDLMLGHIEGAVFDNTHPHDVAIIDVTPNQTVVPLGGASVDINVTAQNQGENTETFTVSAYYYNATVTQQIGTLQNVNNLGPATSTTLTFTWNTAGVSLGSYTIKANASTVTEEFDTADNSYIDGNVTIVLVHDVAIIDVTPNQTVVAQGAIVGINVTAKNEGHYMESFNVSARADLNVTQTKSVTDLASGASTILTLTWNTSLFPWGSYIISANASWVTNETEVLNNAYIDGTVTISSVHDVAIIDVTPNQTAVAPGAIVDINVTAKNEGTYTESFNVAAYYYNATVTQQIGTSQDVTNLDPSNTATLTFTWNTAGVSLGSYTIKANASIVTGEIDTADNTYIDGTVTVASLEEVDVAVTDVVPWKNNCPVPVTQAYPAWTVNINVTVLNNGASPATFTVSAYANETLIGTQPVNDLPAGQNTTITFNWPLTSVPLGPYTLKANATLVGDTNPGDNEFIFGQFLVKLDGDVNGNRVVESTDLIFGFAPAYGSKPGDPNWNCQADFNDSDSVESTDLIFGLAPNYGKPY